MDGINTFRELEPNSVVKDLVELIDRNIGNFSSSDSFINILKKKKNENQHSEAFCNFMNLRTRNKSITLIQFQREIAQKGNRTVDIGVYLGTILVYTIESKLLPTPKGSKGSPRNEYEYVYGKGGGIQRFKDNHHGLDHDENLLRENGLIAFVKENKFDFWHKKINQWILDASWNKSERLKKVYFNSTTARLNSNHKRIDGSDVILHHFWVYVVPTK